MENVSKLLIVLATTLACLLPPHTHATPLPPTPPEGGSCECGLFLVAAPTPSPAHRVFGTGEQYPVDCGLGEEGVRQRCGELCQQEVTHIQEVFSLHPEAAQLFPPTADCALLPAPTATFYSACGGGWRPLPLPSYRHVCCHPARRESVWCDSLQITPDIYSAVEEEQFRGLDLTVAEDDILNNEIDGSTKPQKWTPPKDESQSYVNTALKYFGYDSITDVIKNFDVFALPQLFRETVKEYRDEVNMGQCYMEFTTYSLFTKGENPFQMFTRTKRDIDNLQDVWNDNSLDLSFDHINETLMNVQEFIKVNLERINECSPDDDESKDFTSRESKQAQIETIRSLVGSLVGMLRQSESTRRYASVIEQLLPVVTSVYAAEDPQAAVNTLVTSVLGPYLEKMHGGNKKKKVDSIDEKKDRIKIKKIKGSQPERVPSSDTSPLASMALSLFRQYFNTYFNSLPGDVPNKHSDADSGTFQSDRPSSAMSSNVLKLVNLFLGGGSKPRPKPRPSSKPVAENSLDKVSQDKIDNFTKAEADRPKDFIDVILEIIRPVFISILGKAPGGSGVSTIREISRLSVLGRVDDDIAQEVLSPYFCLKTYGINKAWTLTESSLRSVMKELSPEEKETMRALLL